MSGTTMRFLASRYVIPRLILGNIMIFLPF